MRGTSATRQRILEQLADKIAAIRRTHPVRVTIDGPDAAGKTLLAEELFSIVSEKKRAVIRASIDGFHRPRKDRYGRFGDTAEAFYRDSFDYEALRSNLLLPLGPGGTRHYRVAIFNFRVDHPRETPECVADLNDILLFDGIFLLRPEIIDCWDFRIFLQVDFQETLRRAMERDQSLFGTPDQVHERYENKYIPGQRIYFNEVNPQSLADVVIDNNDPLSPKILARL